MTKAVRNAARIDLLGADELSTALATLPVTFKRQVLAKAVTKAGRVMVPPLRRATPKSKRGNKKNPPGTMRKSTGIVTRKYKGGAVAASYTGHRWPKGAAAHLVDAGTATRKTAKGFNRGQTSPLRFFDPVYRSQKAQVEAKLKSELSIGLELAREKAAMKALKRAVNR